MTETPRCSACFAEHQTVTYSMPAKFAGVTTAAVLLCPRCDIPHGANPGRTPR